MTTSALVEKLRARAVDCDCSPTCQDLLRQAVLEIESLCIDFRKDQIEIMQLKEELEIAHHSLSIWCAELARGLSGRESSCRSH